MFSLKIRFQLIVRFAHLDYDVRMYNTIQYNTIILLFHLISYETFTKYFRKQVQHKYKEWEVSEK